MLNNLTRDHPTAHGKVKQSNLVEKSGILAWCNLRSFYKEETDQYKTDAMNHALRVTKCNTMEQLQQRLDKWLYAVAKTARLGYPIPEHVEFCLFK